MDIREFKRLLEAVGAGRMDAESAYAMVSAPHSYADIGGARVDHGRRSRCGFPEFVYGESKTAAQITAVSEEIVRSGQPLLVTRISPEKAAEVRRTIKKASYDETARCLYMKGRTVRKISGKALIVTAGTSDLYAAREAELTLELAGCDCELLCDAGVAGIHRLLAETPKLKTASVIIAVAGMEGALPSVVGGLASCPVIAVPTSVGYGTSLGGFTALLAMLNSCASGVSVMNIDNGFGAACAALRVLNTLAKNK